MGLNVYEIEERAILQCDAEDTRVIHVNGENDFSLESGLGDNM